VSVTFERAVHFQDIDAAGIVFFARFFDYAHDAMENFFDGIAHRPGGVRPGYVDLVMKRRIGFPVVHIEADFRTPLRYGDAVRIETTVAKIGTSSITFRYAMTRVSDGKDVATLEHVVVATSVDTVTKVDLPEDVLVLLRAHTGA
jgi:4-hydroxybenzoyl-CoA thioesterase